MGVPAPIKPFFCWIVVGASTVLSGTWGMFHCYGVFFTPLSQEFGWDRALTSSVASLQFLVAALSQLVMGRLADRFDPRPVAAVGALLMCVGLTLCSQIQSIWHFYLFYLTAAVGLGTAWAIPFATTQRWFIKRRGLATGIVAGGLALEMMVFAPLADYLISSFGWRNTYVMVGSGMWPILTLAALAMVHSPQKLGLKPYGFNDSPATGTTERKDGGGKGSKVVAEQEWTTGEALRTKGFYGLCVLNMFTLFGVMMVTLHLVPFAIDLGIPSLFAASSLSILGAVSLVGRLGMGGVADRIGWLKAFIVCVSLGVATMIWLLNTRSLWMLYLFVPLFGLVYGGRSSLLPGMVGFFFGTVALTELIALNHAVGLIGAAAGVYAAGWIFDQTGSYFNAYAISTGLFIASAVISVAIKPPRKQIGVIS